MRLRHEFIKLLSCSTELSMIFQLIIKTKMLKDKILFSYKLSDVILIIMLINVRMPTLVGIFTFMSRIKSMLS